MIILFANSVSDMHFLGNIMCYTLQNKGSPTEEERKDLESKTGLKSLA